MTDWEQKGFDAYLKLWVETGERPPSRESLSACTARPGTDERREFMKGWLAARDES